MLEIDGAAGEGGGQILRTALALSVLTGTPFRIARIRARRKRPGLLRQHLAAVHAAAAISGADTRGARLHSLELEFVPRAVRPGNYMFEVGSAGSACLVLQTVLLPLSVANGPSSVCVEGGTHNPLAPPFDYLQHVYAPLLARMGLRCRFELERYGFFPQGDGRCRMHVEPAETLRPLELLERGAVRSCRAVALVANLPLHIANRELGVVGQELGWPPEALEREVVEARGPGNALLLSVEAEHVTEMVVGFGARGVRAETVARRAVRDMRAYLELSAPVGPHLADQLLPPLALVGAGAFRTGPLTPHAETNIAVLRQFLHSEVTTMARADGTVLVRLSS